MDYSKGMVRRRRKKSKGLIEKQNHLSKRINEVAFHLQDANTNFEESLKLIKKNS